MCIRIEWLSYFSDNSTVGSFLGGPWLVLAHVNTTKSHVVKTSESKFLGFTFNRGRIQWHPKTLLKFKQRVRRLTNRNWGVSMHYQLFKISQYLRGWINYFGIANCYQRCVELDHWIRRRVRMAYWRQWRKPRTKVRSLMRLGRSDARACTSCGCLWHHQ
jgi:RNA-directed DNA polymerase